jgi:hypothetical protein
VKSSPISSQNYVKDITDIIVISGSGVRIAAPSTPSPTSSPSPFRIPIAKKLDSTDCTEDPVKCLYTMVIRHRETTAIDAHRAVLSHLSFVKRCGILSLEITHDVTFPSMCRVVSCQPYLYVDACM